MTGNSFSADVAAIHDRARQKMDRGTVTENYGTGGLLAEEHADDILDLFGSDAYGS